MGYCRQTSLPATEPVTLAQAKSFMRLPSGYTAEDSTITAFITAAREQGELITGRGLAQRTWTQVLDSFPYFTDTVQSQLAYPPSYYSLPRYSTTLWNYSQMIKLSYPPVLSVQGMNYVDSSGNPQTLYQDTDFVLDRITEPPRIFPQPGQYWPPSLYVANSLQVNFTAGYDPNPNAIDTHYVDSPPVSSPPDQQPVSTIVTGIPQMMILGILNLVAFWFNNRGSVGIVPDGTNRTPNILGIFLQNQVQDFVGNRG